MRDLNRNPLPLGGVSVKIWIVSDTHFFHKNILKYANRPFNSIEDMNATIIKNWNKLVSPEDIVYHLGDFGFVGPTEGNKLVSQLSGNIFLIRGNHCESPSVCYNMGFKGVYESLDLLYKGHSFHLRHFPKPKGSLVVKLFVKEILEFLGIKFTKKWLNKEKRTLIPQNMYLLHGHTHGNTAKIRLDTKEINCCVEHWQYRPILLDSIVSLIQKEQGKCQKELTQKTTGNGCFSRSDFVRGVKICSQFILTNIKKIVRF